MTNKPPDELTDRPGDEPRTGILGCPLFFELYISHKISMEFLKNLRQ